MSWLDIVILVIIGLSALISLVRGFVKESISLVSWILAGVVALRYFSALAGLLEPYVANEMLRNMSAFGLLFVVTLIIGAIVNFMMSQLVSKTGGRNHLASSIFSKWRNGLKASFRMTSLPTLISIETRP